jgi:hypothetical protein
MKVTRYIITILMLISITGTTAFAADTLYDNRFKQWLAKAQTGDSFSQYSLGNAYLRGNEVSIDQSKAIHWFKEAAKQGHAKSQYKLGYLYYSGKGVKRSYGSAFEWFELAANSEYSPAQFYLGKMYAAGQGTDKDYTKSLDWLNKALANDYSPASREIERVERKLQVARQKQQKKAAATVTVKEPVKEIVVAKVSKPKPRPKPAAKSKTSKKSAKSKKRKSVKKNMKVADMLLLGNWMMEDKPTEILPSGINECNATSNELYCKTNEIHITTEYADVNYTRESIAGRFNEDKKSFTVKNKKNTLFVMPSDPDDPDVDPDNIPATGIETQVMKCKFESNDKIRCYNDDFQKVYFTRK